jgi:hypothetical protein
MDVALMPQPVNEATFAMKYLLMALSTTAALGLAVPANAQTISGDGQWYGGSAPGAYAYDGEPTYRLRRAYRGYSCAEPRYWDRSYSTYRDIYGSSDTGGSWDGNGYGYRR